MSINTFMQELILLGSVVASIISFAVIGSSKCSGTTFGAMVTALAAVLMVSAIIIEVLKLCSYMTFTSSGRLPGIFSFLFKDGV